MSIPVVDFGAYSLTEKDVTNEQISILAEQLKEAFMEVGFVFLKNTGITKLEVDRVLDSSKKFFLQPNELKQPFRRQNFPDIPNHGWLDVETERFDHSQPGDLKESYNFVSPNPDIQWPSSGALKGFREIHVSFYMRCKELGLRVLRVMAHSLGLDPEVFLSAHRFIGTNKNGSNLRTLYYPPIDVVKDGQVRCGEHSDYGSITLLFQGSEGLQVRKRSGEFITAPIIPDAVLINIADLMQRWTCDQFISVRHRVLLPPAGVSSTRQSVAFFVQPDNDVRVTCLDGSKKYPPVRAQTYLQDSYGVSYE